MSNRAIHVNAMCKGRCEEVNKVNIITLKINHEILLHMNPMRMIRNSVDFRGCFSKIVQPTSVQKEKEWVSGGQIKHELQGTEQVGILEPDSRWTPCHITVSFMWGLKSWV